MAGGLYEPITTAEELEQSRDEIVTELQILHRDQFVGSSPFRESFAVPTSGPVASLLTSNKTIITMKHYLYRTTCTCLPGALCITSQSEAIELEPIGRYGQTDPEVFDASAAEIPTYDPVS